MPADTNQSDNAFGLLACGSSGCWTVDLDESMKGTEFSLQLDGPQFYFAFAVRSPTVVIDVLAYLRSPRNGAIWIGNFGSAGVALHWDAEDPRRCFLIVGPHAHATMRVTLHAEDIRMLAEALEQLAEDLPPAPVTGPVTG